MMNRRTNGMKPDRARAVVLPAPAPGAGLTGLGEALVDLMASATTAIGQAVRDVQQRRAERKAMAELGRLSNHALKDIGIHRSEISSLVNGSRARAERMRHVED